ncbi:MAG TPA: hypothetical protein VIL74_24400 [Pyrinomonadaceae bacterium]|jgi:hypothetical protein
MTKFAALILFVFCFVLLGDTLHAQSAQARTDALVAALAKTKYKKKEKKNISIEIYIDIKSEPVVKSNPSEYSGVYEADGYRLDLRVNANGSAEGSGYDRVGDGSARQNFTLREARVEGALLTATKIYDGGAAEPFEALFNNRIIVQGKNANELETRESFYGIGFVQNRSDWNNRVFLELK